MELLVRTECTCREKEGPQEKERMGKPCVCSMQRGVWRIWPKNERGLELVKDGKNYTERNKGCDMVQEREQHGTVNLGMS